MKDLPPKGHTKYEHSIWSAKVLVQPIGPQNFLLTKGKKASALLSSHQWLKSVPLYKVTSSRPSGLKSFTFSNTH